MPPSAHFDGNAEFVHGTVLCASHYQFHRMAFTDWGRGGERGTVVCVHGLTRQGRDFDPLARELAAQGYRVICPDLVGRGVSDRLSDPRDYDLPQYVLDLTTLLANVGATQVTWVGCSLGGLIGIIMAGMSNSPIGRLLVNDIGPHLPLDALLRIGRYVRAGPARFTSTEAVASYFQEILAPFGRLTPEHWRHLAKHSVMADGEGGYRLRYDPLIVKGFRPPWIHTRRLWSLWDRIECPTLLLRGADSDLLLRSTAAEMLARNPNARFVEIPNCGHMPPLLDAAHITMVSDWINGRGIGLSAVRPVGEGGASRRNYSMQLPLDTR
jgi:pimeloyl-ACP methyl ester carboxylesterase